jgi:hypothetical protein
MPKISPVVYGRFVLPLKKGGANTLPKTLGCAHHVGRGLHHWRQTKCRHFVAGDGRSVLPTPTTDNSRCYHSAKEGIQFSRYHHSMPMPSACGDR